MPTNVAAYFNGRGLLDIAIFCPQTSNMGMSFNELPIAIRSLIGMFFVAQIVSTGTFLPVLIAVISIIICAVFAITKRSEYVFLNQSAKVDKALGQPMTLIFQNGCAGHVWTVNARPRRWTTRIKLLRNPGFKTALYPGATGF